MIIQQWIAGFIQYYVPKQGQQRQYELVRLPTLTRGHSAQVTLLCLISTIHAQYTHRDHVATFIKVQKYLSYIAGDKGEIIFL